jgi:Ca-activated chloride channel homolog
MEWGQPQNWTWFWAVPAAAALFLLSSWRKKNGLARFGDAALVERLVGSLDPLMRWMKRLLMLAALACMVTALAQPHVRGKETQVERRGIDVLIALDVSNSMLAKDIPPNRLEKAKLELAGLVDTLKGNRLGVIAFAGEAVIQCPLTLDRGAVKMFLSSADPNLLTFQGTDLGKALGASLQAFQDKGKDSKALIMLTDGEDHGKETMQWVKKAKEAGVRVFTIGIGTPDGATLADERGGIKKDRGGNVVLSKLGEARLKEIAKETGGVYFRSTKGDLESGRLKKEIDRIATKGLATGTSVEYEENYQFFLVLAFALLALEMCLSEGRRTP